MKKIFLASVVAVTMVACQNNDTQKTTETTTATEQVPVDDYTLIGKKGKLVYPEFTAEVSYVSDSTLHWKTTSPDGKVAEGDEKIFLKKLNESQYFLNWIEQDGLSISQVIDLKHKTVTAFGTFADDQSLRGKRSSMNLEGTFEFTK